MTTATLGGKERIRCECGCGQITLKPYRFRDRLYVDAVHAARAALRTRSAAVSDPQTFGFQRRIIRGELTRKS